MTSFSMELGRRHAALRFLNSISLDSQPVIKESENQGQSRYGTSLSVKSSSPASKTTTENKYSIPTNAEKESLYLAANSSISPEAIRQGYSSVAQCPDALGQSSDSTCMKIGSSMDFAEELQSRCSTGLPDPKSCKKVHFIKNMRQHDTRNGRIVLISLKRALYGVFSVVPYQDLSQFGDMKHFHSGMGTRVNTTELEGVKLGAEGKTVSYTELLYPTLCGPISNVASRPCTLHIQGPVRGIHSHKMRGIEARDYVEYDPNLIDDPQWPCGKHKRVLVFQSYMTTVIEYVKPSDLKRDMNDTFGEKFPHVQITLSKIRSLKREIRKLAQDDCGYEEPTVAMAFVYFEKLAIHGKINKQNRKLCAGACILLAAKIASDLRRPEVKCLIDRLEEKFRLNRKDLLAIELSVLVALEFKLHLPHHEMLHHYRRLLLTSYNQKNQ